MTIEQQVANLTTAIDTLTETVLIKRVALDGAVAQADLDADRAEAARIAASLYDPTFRYASRAAFASSTRAAGGVGTVWQLGSSLFDEAPLSASDAHLANNATPPVKVYARALPQGFNLADFGAVGGNAQADTEAFMKAAALPSYKSFLVPASDVPYIVNETVMLKDGHKWTFAGARIGHADETKAIFWADSIIDWSFDGDLDLIGNLVTGANVPTDIGLRITNGKRYQMTNTRARNFKGRGFLLDGTNAWVDGKRADRGQWINCGVHRNTLGLEAAPGAGAEYNLFTNFNATGNALAASIDAANNAFVNCKFVDNTSAVTLTGATNRNHGHGTFVSCDFNHNSGHNLRAENVTLGYSLVGCHFYGDGANVGEIHLVNSAGIDICDGIIDCDIYNDTGADAGINSIRGNFFPTNHAGGTAKTRLMSLNGGLDKLEVLGNRTKDGPSALNDPSAVFVRATRGGSTQALTSATLNAVLWNSKSGDKKGGLDTGTGVWTAPVTGIYRVSVSAVITGTGLSLPYGEIRVAGARFSMLAGSLASTTVAIVQGTVDVVLTAGQTMDVRVQVTGTSPVLAQDTSRMSITLLQAA